MSKTKSVFLVIYPKCFFAVNFRFVERRISTTQSTWSPKMLSQIFYNLPEIIQMYTRLIKKINYTNKNKNAKRKYLDEVCRTLFDNKK